MLEIVQQRVITQISASEEAPFKVLSAGIDKLEGYFASSLIVDDVLTLTQMNGYTHKYTRLNEQGLFISFNNGDGTIHLKLHYDKAHFTKFIINPNRFKTWNSFVTFFKVIIPPYGFNTATISRMDLNIDFQCEFMQFIKHFDIKFKRSSFEFFGASGKREGLRIGKGNEKIVIYDKSEEMQTDTPLTRMELRVAQCKIPCKLLKDITPEILQQNFFKNIVGLNVYDGDMLILPEQQEKLTKFRSALSKDGFHLTTAILDKNGNFKRDYAKIIKVKTWEKQPDQLFREHIRSFTSPVSLIDPDNNSR